MRLQGKTAIVTGAAQGFGEGIARRFAEEGARVMVADLKGELAHDVASQIGGLGHGIDITDPDSLLTMFDRAEAELGPVDILVNNAGVTHLPKPMEDVSEEDFDLIYAVNVKAIYRAAKILVPRMKQQGSGAILNISSTAGISPRPNLTWYNASKGWVNTATRSMAVELAPFGIRVNAVNPVAGETPLLQSFMGEDTPEVRAKFLSSIPMGRFTTPKDIADAALYLCSDEAGMVTGMCMTVDGGRCI
ncbi:SDR family oxidoreductase [Pseudooceanicola sediminis]|uniref:SDR family oxidoreductase n=1 Tax=Pseudooceanicola sediminis TaxID=2211117 RepID=A0A399IWI5_9RHOB|nr:SDR family oxidoreductase [Pseudooceanicola sediminis]KAA2312506.1 SDR family oxidoreductase [Puniceibacterium sp. HSS470]RII37515.1 SDR family oxidoreductase [Pseudooceanicola sediminis]|tara:strand:- start:4042 stop:4782 length:741 start_codon:yes stop_codon:yes gene_type:complete